MENQDYAVENDKGLFQGWISKEEAEWYVEYYPNAKYKVVTMEHVKQCHVRNNQSTMIVNAGSPGAFKA